MVSTDAQICGNRHQLDILTAYACDQEAGHETMHEGPAVTWEAGKPRPPRKRWISNAIPLTWPSARTDAETLATIRAILPKYAEIGRPGKDSRRLTLIRELLYGPPENDGAPRYGGPVGETGGD